MDNSKVVPLKPRTQIGREQQASKPVLSLPVEKLQDRAQRDLAALLQEMFDHTDDALFELADKADSNVEQNLFFEAMREVRIQRRGIEKRFSENLNNGFAALAHEVHEKFSQKAENESELSLLGQDEMEEQVAIDSMVNKNTSQYAQQLAMLTARIDSLVKADVSAKINPLGVRNICESFMQACKQLEVGIKAKLVFYKLFERYVLAQLANTYQQLNQMLIADGVLPALNPETLHNPNNRRQAPAQTSAAAPSQTTAPLENAPNDNGFAEADALLNELGSLMHSGGRMVSANPNSGLQPVGSAPALPRSTMMSLLGSLQQQQSVEFQQLGEGGAANQGNWQPDPNAVMRLLNAQVQQHFDSPQSLGKVEDDVMNLVQLLFQFILDDKNLAEPMKALIARLQIPMLKVALLDRSFFSKGGHPARKLLNEVATAAIGWMPPAEGKRDPLFEKVAKLVDSLLHDFVEDIGMFQTIYEDFKTFVELEKRRSSLIEQRTVDAEDGKAKSESARERVQGCVDERIVGCALPQVALDIINQAWKNYMLLVLLKEGEQAEAWEQAISTLDKLLWSVRPAADFTSPDALLKTVPGLLKELRAGMSKLGFNPFDMNKMFAELEAEHLNRIKAMRSQSQLDQSNTVVVEAQAKPADIQAEVPLSLQRQIDAIATGTWVEFVDGDKRLRCRLAARIKHTSTLIFVNRNGQKVAEYKTPDIAEKIQNGSMVILDDSLLFDRALESVITNLRQKK